MSDSGRNPTDTRAIEPNVAALLANTGRSTTFTLEPLKGGRNNRTFRVRADDGDSLLKWYFSHQRDDRDRLGTEFEFCCCLWRHGLRQIAKPLGADRTVGLGLYQFLSGRTPTPGDVTPEHHDQAIEFLRNIAAVRAKPDALLLPPASEACFSLADHVERIGQRLQRLTGVATADEIGQEMVEFVRQHLQPAFQRHRFEIAQWAARDKLDMQATLPANQRCLSPSDFGFHNTLLQDDGSLRFVDFEYAGWDDPAKLVGDFFCQIEVPALVSGFNAFLDRVAELSKDPEAVVQRARQLFPFYQIKWCCIVLNDFLPAGEARRSFSEPRYAQARRAEQLAIARRLFHRLGCLPESGC